MLNLKHNLNFQRQASLFIAVFFLLSSCLLLAIPYSAEAALSVGNSYDSCYNNLKTESVADIKSKKYVEKRRTILDKTKKELIDKTNENIKRFNNQSEKIKTKTLPQLEELRKKGLVGEPANPEYAATPIPAAKTDINTLMSHYNNADQKISGAEKVLANSNSTRYQVVTSVCRAVHEGKVFNTVLPMARKTYTQSRIDVLYLNNYVHFTRANIARDVFDAKYIADDGNSLESNEGDEVFLTANAYYILAAEHFEQIEDDENALNSSQFDYAKTKASITETRDQIKAILVDLEDPMKITLKKPIKKEKNTSSKKKEQREKKKSEKRAYKPQYTTPKYTAPKKLQSNPSPNPKSKKPNTNKPKVKNDGGRHLHPPKKAKLKKCLNRDINYGVGLYGLNGWLCPDYQAG